MRELIRKILNEEVPTQVRRRIPTFEDTFKHYRDAFSKSIYRNFDIYWYNVMERVSETLYHAWFVNTVPEDKWEESEKFIQDYLTKKYKDETRQMWEKKHHKRLNETKEETNYLPIIENIVEPFKEDVCICNIDMWYDDEDDMYSVYLVFGTEELDGKFTSDGKFGYVRKKQKEVEETIKSYLPIKNIRVGSYGTPHCGWSPLNESEEKNQSLLSLIDEHGLYEFMKMTGLSLKEIISKTGELPREVYERFIKDFINEEGYHQTDGRVQLGYEVEIQTHVYIDHFYMEGDKVTFEIKRFDNRGHQTEGYIESMLNLTDEEILGIVEDMIKWGPLTDYEI